MKQCKNGKILQEDFIDIPNEKLIIPILFVALMAVGGILHIIPPETNQRRLPETSEEANVSRCTFFLIITFSAKI